MDSLRSRTIWRFLQEEREWDQLKTFEWITQAMSPCLGKAGSFIRDFFFSFNSMPGGTRELWEKEKKELFWGQSAERLFFWEKKTRKVFYPAFAFVLMGDGEGPSDILPCWCWASKFQAGWLCFCERMKLQLHQILNLGLVSWAFNMNKAIWGLWFSV